MKVIVKSMKHLILALALLAFLVGGLADYANAAIQDAFYICCSADGDDAESNCLDTQNEGDIDQCKDCCCHHTHVIAKIHLDTIKHSYFNTKVVRMVHQEPHSRALSPLYRPPIV